MISQWSVLNAPIITVCHRFYISQHWLQLLHTVRGTFELAHSPKECCATNNLGNSLCTFGKHSQSFPGSEQDTRLQAVRPGSLHCTLAQQQAHPHESLLPAARPIPTLHPTCLTCATRTVSPSLDSCSEPSENNANDKLLYQHSWGVMNCKKEVGFGQGKMCLWPAVLWKSASLWLLLSVTAGVWEKWHWLDNKKLVRGDI